MKKIILFLFAGVLATSMFAQQLQSYSDVTKDDFNSTSQSGDLIVTPGNSNKAVTTTFTDRATFQTATSSLALVTENFDGAPGGITTCGASISSAGDGCYPPGEIEDGIIITASAGDVVSISSGSIGNTIHLVGANTFTDYTILSFPNNDIKAVGHDLRNDGDGTTEYRVYGMGGALISTYSLVHTPGTENFFGFVADEVITRVEFEAGASGGELFGALEFAANELPVISCPADAVADSEPGVCGAIVNFADASAIDFEDGPLATTQTMGPASGSVFPIGVTTIEFSATDSTGLTVTCQFTVTVNDVEDPMAVCQDITVELDASGMVTVAAADLDGGSTDNCSIVSYELVDPDPTSMTECGNAPELIPASGTSGPMNPSVANVSDSGIIGVNYNVGNVTLNLQHTWASDLDMTLTSPAGTVLELSTDNGGSSGLDTAADLVFTDASGNLITAWGSGAPAADYQAEGGLFNTVFAGEDINGSWTLNITDDTGGDSGMLNSFCITFSEAATTPSLTFTCDNVGTNDVTLLVTDASGNTSTCMAVVTVEDNQAPVIICAGSGGLISVVETFEGATVPAGWTTVVETGSQDWAFGSGDLPYVIPEEDFPTNAAIFDDDAAGPGAVNFARLVSPAYDLTGVLAAEISFDYYFRQYEAVESLNAEVWDGAAWQEVFFVNTDGPIANSGVIDVLAYANANFQVRFNYDDAGAWGYAAGIDNATVSYEVAGTPPLEVVLDPTGHATVDLNDLLISVDDNCGYTVALGDGTANPCQQENPSNGFEDGNSTTGDLGRSVANDVTVEADMDFTLDQVTANIFNLPGETVLTVDVKYYADNAGSPGAEIGSELGVVPTSQTVLGDNFGYDISAVVLDVTPYTFPSQSGTPTTYWIGLSVFNSGASNNFWEISTASGNGFDTHYDDGSGVWQVLTAGADGVYVFSGMCGSGASRATMDVDCSNLGENMVDVAVTDAGGNVATCTATFIVLDETAPVVVCGPDPLVYGANSVSDSPALAIPDANPAGVTTTVEVTEDFVLTDVNIPVNITHTWRGDLDITVTSPAGTTVVLKTADIGDSADDVIVTYDDEGTAGVEALSAFDGESSLGTWTLFVADQFGGDTGTINSWGVEYEYSYPNPETELFIELGPDGTVTITPEDITSELEDACGIDVMLLDITEFSCDDIGAPILVTLFVNDTSGNFASCQVEVNIVDTMAPTLVCPDPGMYGTEPSNNDGVYIVRDYYDIGAATYSDNCTEAGSLIVTQTPAPGTAWGINGTGNPGPYEVVFTVEDEYGNISTCTLEVTVTNGIGVTENTLLANALGLYPNPASDQVTLVNTSDIALQTAMIYDLNGKLVADIDLSNMQNETSFDVSDFASGVYMVKIVGENANTVKRLVKK